MCLKARDRSFDYKFKITQLSNHTTVLHSWSHSQNRTVSTTTGTEISQLSLPASNIKTQSYSLQNASRG